MSAVRIVVSLDDAALGAGPVSDPAAGVRLGAALRALDPAHELVLVYGAPRDADTDPAAVGLALAGLFGAPRSDRRPVTTVLTRAVVGDPDDDHGDAPSIAETCGIADLLDGGSSVVCSAAAVVDAPAGYDHVLRPVGTSWDAHRTAVAVGTGIGAARLVLLGRAADEDAIAIAGEFVRATGASAAVGTVDELAAVVAGTAGTEVTTPSHEAADRAAEVAAAWAMLS